MFESKQNISPSPRLSKPANSESANSANSANSATEATEATEAPSFPHARTHYFASVSPRCCFLINPSIRNPTNDGGVALSTTDSHRLPPSTLTCSRPKHDPACPRRYTCPTRRKLQCRTQAQQQAAQPTQRLTARQHLPSTCGYTGGGDACREHMTSRIHIYGEYRYSASTGTRLPGQRGVCLPDSPPCAASIAKHSNHVFMSDSCSKLHS